MKKGSEHTISSQLLPKQGSPKRVLKSITYTQNSNQSQKPAMTTPATLKKISGVLEINDTS